MRASQLLCFLILITRMVAQAQEDPGDSVRTLGTVHIRAYEQNRRLIDVAAPVGITTAAQLNRIPANSILPAVNIIPGIRMEERSPGSYRLNIRGSSLRAPFGVRDVKIYLNEIPLTDPSGNTYLNQLSYYHFNSVEFIKGPASSLYGAGIGGAMLIRTQANSWQPGVAVDLQAGSYQYRSFHTTIRAGDADNRQVIDYTRQESDGYRVQTRMHKDVISWEGSFRAGSSQTLHSFFSYSDFYYQTPGGLNRVQFLADAKQARPATASQPGAVQNKAAVFQKVFLAGVSDQIRISNAWQQTTTVYGSYTDFINPGIRVYEYRKEPHLGLRSVFTFRKKFPASQLQFNAGIEAQKGFFNTRDFGNKNGVADSLQLDNDINLWQYIVFAQADLRLRGGWTLTAGASLNRSSVEFLNLLSRPSTRQQRRFNNKVPPHLAILKSIGREVSVYTSLARGFSPPTVAEVLRSDGLFGKDLQAQVGTDYEVGIRGNLFHSRFYFDVNAFFLHLDQTIVQRIDSFGVFYFVNAGSTRQNGVEAYLSYDFITRPGTWLDQAKAWMSAAFNDFHYREFKQVNNDFSGRTLPGVPDRTFSAGLDLDSRTGVYIRMTYQHSGTIQLNDANTEQGGTSDLFGTRIGWRKDWKKTWRLDLFGGGENLTDARYSLGYDINAAAGRYYNAAPGRNFYAGVGLRWLRKKHEAMPPPSQ